MTRHAARAAFPKELRMSLRHGLIIVVVGVGVVIAAACGGSGTPAASPDSASSAMPDAAMPMGDAAPAGDAAP